MKTQFQKEEEEEVLAWRRLVGGPRFEMMGVAALNIPISEGGTYSSTHTQSSQISKLPRLKFLS